MVRSYQIPQMRYFKYPGQEIYPAMNGSSQDTRERPIERRKVDAWCKEHKCPMSYCNHDRRHRITGNGVEINALDESRK